MFLQNASPPPLGKKNLWKKNQKAETQHPKDYFEYILHISYKMLINILIFKQIFIQPFHIVNKVTVVEAKKKKKHAYNCLFLFMKLSPAI